VVTDNFYPGWVATLYREDAEEVTLDIMPADLAFRGVYLPAGTHTVHFSYRPRSVLYGAVLGGVLLLLLLSICLVPPCRSLLSRRAVPGYADSGGG